MGRIEKLFTGIVVLGLFLIFSSYSFNKTSNFKNDYEHKKSFEDLENKRTLCLIMTSEKTFIERVITSWETWAHKCDKAVFLCNCNFTKKFNLNRVSEDIEHSELAPILQNILQLDVIEDYNSMAEKAITALWHIYRQYIDKFKWFLLVDDDTYVFVENLKTFIGELNHTKPFTYGFNFKNEEIVSTGYHSGGGGILFTHESLKRIYNSIKDGKCNHTLKMSYGDIAIGECSRVSGVQIGDSLDEKKRERFHALSYNQHSRGAYSEWVFKYSANPLRSGRECCSDETITFHYTSPDEMRRLARLKNEKNLTELFNSFF